MSYIVDPSELIEAGFKGKNLPTIIPMGDSQTEPHPTLAQGIADGLDRVDAFIEHIEVYNGGIAFCEVDDYKLAIDKLMAKHKDRIKVKYQSRERTSYEMLLLAQTNYATVLAKATDEAEITYLTNVLNEIKARFAYHETITIRASLLIEGKEELSTLNNTPDELRVKLNSLTELLTYAYEHIPFNFALEKENISLMLKQTAGYLKECGTRFIKIGDNIKALMSYQEALKLYDHPSLASLQLEKTTILSNIVITFRKLGLHDEAVHQGIAALEGAPKSAEFTEIRKKILYNTLKSLQTLMQNCSADKELERSFHRYRALELMGKNPKLLERSTYTEFCLIYDKKIDLDEAIMAVTAPSNPFSFLGDSAKAVLNTAMSLGSQFSVKLPFS